MPIRILLADDHGVLRAGLRSLLSAEPDMEVIGEAENGAQALLLARQVEADVIILDISMPDMGGFEAARLMLAERPALRILLLTVHEDTCLLREAIDMGASGYIIKRAIETELMTAVRAVARGDLYVHPSLMRELIEDERPQRPRSGIGAETLTYREVEVLRLIAQGCTNRQIADQLGISIRTVETHRANLMGKLELRGRVELVRYAMQHGLLDNGGTQSSYP